jgi:hypothetical protein
MYRYILTLLLCCTSIAGFAQNGTYTGSQAGVFSFFFDFFTVESPESGTITGPIQLMDYETGQVGFDASGHWNFVQGGTPYDLNLTFWDHPTLRLAFGGNTQIPRTITADHTGTRYIDELYVGYSAEGEFYNTLTINNTDSIVISKLYVAKGATLIHNGPGLLVITEELHNNGTVYSNSEDSNILLEANKDEFLPAMFENTGTWVGELRYEIVENKRADYVGPGALINRWMVSLPELAELAADPDDDYTQEDLEEYIYYITLQIAPYATDEQLAELQDHIDNGLYTSAGSLAGAILENQVIRRSFDFTQYFKVGHPVKGVRTAPAANDITTKAVWQEHRGHFSLEPKQLINKAEDQFDGRDLSEIAGEYPFYISQAYLPSWAGDYNNVLDSLASTGFNVDAEDTLYNISVYLDTAWYNGVEAELVYNAILENEYDSLDTDSGSFAIDPQEYGIFFSFNTALFTTPYPDGFEEDLIPGHYPGTFTYPTTVAYQEANPYHVHYTPYANYEDEDTYGFWFDGYREKDVVSFWPNTFSGQLIWTNLPSDGINGNRLWEHPEHLMVADTSANTLFLELFPNEWNNLENQPGANFVLPRLHDADNPGLEQFYEDYPNPYPIFAEHYSSNSDASSPYAYKDWGAFQKLDATTPRPFPMPDYAVIAGSNLTERIVEYRGKPWVNTDEGYNATPYHRQFGDQPLIPNLRPGQSEEDDITLITPTQDDIVYVYAPSGDLFADDVWQNCIDTASTLYDDIGGDNYEQVCIEHLVDEHSGQTIMQLTGYSIGGGSEILYGPGYQSSIGDEAYNQIKNSTKAWDWVQISNPYGGYLDLDEVAEDWFAEQPDANYLEFAWYSRGAADYAYWANMPSELLPDWIDPDQANTPYVYNQTSAERRYSRFWRRKYYRFQDEIIASEMDYVLTRLYAQYVANGGDNMSELAIEAAEAWLDGVLNQNDGPIYDYLIGGDLRPNTYTQLGRYVPPANGFWVRNASADEAALKFKSEHVEFDYDFWETNNNEVFVGELGPHLLMLNNYGENAILDIIASDTPTSYTMYPPATTVIAHAMQNDSTYYPYLFFNHSFDDNATNGTHQIDEEPPSEWPATPFLWTDSTHFRATNVVSEFSPHNTTPLHGYIPQCPAGGAWVIEPLEIQASGSQFLDDVEFTALPRLAFELYDTSGVFQGIEYLGAGDTWMLADSVYDFPLETYMYFTTLSGDVDGNGVVGSSDLLAVIQGLGCCEGDGCVNMNLIDFNADGCITLTDLLIFISTYGQTIYAGDGSFVTYPAQGGIVEQSTGMVIDEDEIDAIAEVFEGLDTYHAGGFIYDENREMLTSFGQDIRIINSQLQTIARGKHRLRLPAEVIDDVDTYIVCNSKGAYYISGEILEDNSGSYLSGDGYVNADGRTYNLIDGAEIALFEDTMDPTDVDSWILFYSQLDALYNGDSQGHPVSPFISGIYNGLYSGDPETSVQDANNSRLDMLIDAFGAGTADGGIDDWVGGVYGDPMWDVAMARHNPDQINMEKVFPEVKIPLAYSTARETTSLHTNRASSVDHHMMRSPIPGGVGDYFDYYSEISSSHAAQYGNDWGEDLKEFYDAQLHQGVLSGVGNMTLREYFRFKLAGVSPKFGMLIPNSDTDNDKRNSDEDENSFGNPYSLHATVSGPDWNIVIPEATWSPSLCTTYDMWDQYILQPFFATHMGDAPSSNLYTELTSITQDGIERRGNDHYAFFTASNLYDITGSMGPLMYDMNWNNEWDANDLAILQGLFDFWSDLGDDSQHTAVCIPADYYRPATDALNMVTNALPYATERGKKFGTSPRFKQIFTLKEGWNEDVFNWHDCLDYRPYASPRFRTTLVDDSRFAGAIDAIWQDGVDPKTGALSIDPDWLNTSSAPVNTVGTYNSFPGSGSGFNVVPSSTFFPACPEPAGQRSGGDGDSRQG